MNSPLHVRLRPILSALTASLLAISATLASGANRPNSDPGKTWAFKPLVRPLPPQLIGVTNHTSNPIDAFVFQRLLDAGLTPSQQANPRTLIRRVYFDLVGFPPTPEQVRAFAADTRPEVYLQLVEQVLASPHYGERWGQHWLDVARFAESHGFEMNQPRPNAWRYRDYVIEAFNTDKPYDRFVAEQLAGDVLGQDAATGFLVAGPWDQVKSPDPVLTATQRADELHDMVSTTASAFFGITVGCARCHDHKSDPVPQTDYYALKACLADVQHGERRLKEPGAGGQARELKRLKQELEEVDQQLSDFEPLALAGNLQTNVPGRPLRSAVNPRHNEERFAPVMARRLRFTILRTTDSEPCIDELAVYSGKTNIALAAAGTTVRASSVYPNSELHRLEHLNDGEVGNSHSWISNERGQGWVELTFAEQATINRVVWSRDRQGKYPDRLAVEYHIEVAAEGEDWRNIASSIDRYPFMPGIPVPPENELAGLPPAQVDAVLLARQRRALLRSQIEELSTPAMAYAGSISDLPEVVRRFSRGDPMQEREEVQPAALSALAIAFPLDSTERDAGAAASDKQTVGQTRRLALAAWMTDQRNPLTARVLANRIWQYHFGEGLVDTPGDFGASGARPTHPELLDWLAAEFIEPKLTLPGEPGPLPWSIKHLHRLIMTSSTYRQASAFRPECSRIDAGARLLWRFPPRRLEAEVLRDSILAVTGHLDLRIGGPGFSTFEPNDNYVRVYEPLSRFGPGEWRRMVYMTKVRMQQDGTFGAFDCPDGGQVAGRRGRSITPLQALNLLNSAFMLQQSRLFAERLLREEANPRAQAGLAFELAYGREPSAEELSASEAVIRQHGAATFCRSLFNSNEFVFLE